MSFAWRLMNPPTGWLKLHRTLVSGWFLGSSYGEGVSWMAGRRLSGATSGRREAHCLQVMKGVVGKPGRGAPDKQSQGFRHMCENGHLLEAFRIVRLVAQQRISVPVNMLCLLLESCIKLKDAVVGKGVHSVMTETGVQSSLVNNHLIRMYASCGFLADANQLFTSLPFPDLFEWAAIVSAHGKYGDPEQAIKLYQQMKQSNVEPNDYVFVAALKACSDALSLTGGKLIHTHVVELGYESNPYVCSSLIDMYAKCGSLEEARNAFDRLSTKDQVTWTTMITAYAQHGDGDLALQMFQQMRGEGIQADKFTLVSALKACSSTASLDYGKLLYEDAVIKSGFQADVCVSNILIDMYVKCHSLEDARRVFERLAAKDVVSWTAMIAGYIQYGVGEEAIHLFEQMQQDGVRPNKVTVMNMLKACSIAAALDYGKLLHGQIRQRGFASDLLIGNNLIHMYAKCGSLQDARIVFDRLPARSLVTWNVMLSGYVQHGGGQEALHLFQQMHLEGLQPDRITFVAVMNACSSVAALDQGKLLHAHIVENDLESDVRVGSSLIDMYSKCGSLEEASMVFHRQPTKSLVTWNAMISGQALEGDAQEALLLFEQMQREGVSPDEVTFVCLLAACSRAGLWDAGKSLFQSMSEEFNITPGVEHCACMVDLLARAGYLHEAEQFILNMPSQPDVIVWMCLLAGSRTHHNLELGRRAFDSILNIDPTNAGAYVLMSNLYASEGRWEDKAKILNLMQHAGVRKERGCSWVQCDNQVHSFMVADTCHPERSQIYAKLMEMMNQEPP